MLSDQRQIRVAIVGAGISGLAQAIRLRDALGGRVVITVSLITRITLTDRSSKKLVRPVVYGGIRRGQEPVTH
jgi:2-polyprenyl-6-methoxyphenol hydroxylase-like FAD-dependent oxidoreductase